MSKNNKIIDIRSILERKSKILKTEIELDFGDIDFLTNLFVYKMGLDCFENITSTENLLTKQASFSDNKSVVLELLFDNTDTPYLNMSIKDENNYTILSDNLNHFLTDDYLNIDKIFRLYEFEIEDKLYQVDIKDSYDINLEPRYIVKDMSYFIDKLDHANNQRVNQINQLIKKIEEANKQLLENKNNQDIKEIQETSVDTNSTDTDFRDTKQSVLNIFDSLFKR